MISYVKKTALLPVLALVVMSCANNSDLTKTSENPEAAKVQISEATTLQFSDVLNKEWYLAEIRAAPTITLDRGKLTDEGFGDIFTLRFDGERASGVGAPNRYTAPYTLDDQQGLRIKDAASTMMAAFREPEQLKEHEFFVYLHNTVRWSLADRKLELYSQGADGTAAILVFTQK